MDANLVIKKQFNHSSKIYYPNVTNVTPVKNI